MTAVSALYYAYNISTTNIRSFRKLSIVKIFPNAVVHVKNATVGSYLTPPNSPPNPTYYKLNFANTRWVRLHKGVISKL